MFFTCDKKFVSLNADRRPSSKRFRGEKQEPALTGSLRDNPDVRGRCDFWAGTH